MNERLEGDINESLASTADEIITIHRDGSMSSRPGPMAEIDADHWDCLAGPPVMRAEIIFWIVLFGGVALACIFGGAYD